MTIEVKICGLRDETAVKTAVDAGARYVGFVFHKTSTRYVAPQDARELTVHVPPSVMRVGLFVDISDKELREVLQEVPLDLLQLHGNEVPQRVKAIRAMTGIPVMKALRIATEEHLKPLFDFEAVSDRLLFDTRVGEEPTGGTGKSFDWTLLQGKRLSKPWMLAGGLNISNLAMAVQISGAAIIDVSSGVEDVQGRKDPAKIREFIELARSL